MKDRNKNTVKPTHTGQTLQSSREETYGLSTMRPARESRKRIDYLKLNDGLDPSDKAGLPSPKRAKRSPVPARKGPSKDRILARSPVNVNDEVGKNKLTGGTTDTFIGDSELLGGTVPPESQTAQVNEALPDLVVNSNHNISIPSDAPAQPTTTDPTRHDISLDPGTTESER